MELILCVPGCPGGPDQANGRGGGGPGTRRGEQSSPEGGGERAPKAPERSEEPCKSCGLEEFYDQADWTSGEEQLLERHAGAPREADSGSAARGGEGREEALDDGGSSRDTPQGEGRAEAQGSQGGGAARGDHEAVGAGAGDASGGEDSSQDEDEESCSEEEPAMGRARSGRACTWHERRR